jgi:hypothetical protein
MNYGLQTGLQELEAFVLGLSPMPRIPYNESGDWEKFLPKYENQTTKTGQETSGCTVWGSQNQIETFIKGVYGKENNYSERFTYLLVPIQPSKGADPQNTYETIRKHGLVDDAKLPMTDTIAEYLDTTGITGSLRALGQNWLYTHDFKHEWIWTQNNRPDNYLEVLKEELKTCPIGVSVTAWRQVNGAYVSDSGGNNHWCLLYKIDSEGYPWVFDSYDHSKKKLSKDHNIRRAKRIWVNVKIRSSMKKHIGILQSIVNLLMNKKTVLQVCTENLGKDASPMDIVSDDVACAETVTTLLQQVYPKMPKIPGTWTLWQYLKPENGWILCTDPEPECLVISPTGSVPNRIGHVGIVMEDGVIASNDSATGKFMKNYTVKTWHNYYGVKLGMPIYYYKHK